MVEFPENMMQFCDMIFKLNNKTAYATFLLKKLARAISIDRDIIGQMKALMTLPDDYGMEGWPKKYEYIVYLNTTEL